MLEGEPDHQVVRADRVELAPHPLGMDGGEVVEAGGVALEQGAGVGGELALVALLHRLAHREQLHQVVAGGAGAAAVEALLGAVERQQRLVALDVVLGVGVGQAEGDVGVAAAEDVRHAPAVAHDLGPVGGGRGAEGGGVEAGAPAVADEQVEGDKQRGRRHGEDGEPAGDAPGAAGAPR